jgi:hypothetical protein
MGLSGDRHAWNRRICSRHQLTGFPMWNVHREAAQDRRRLPALKIKLTPTRHGLSLGKGIQGYSNPTVLPLFPVTPEVNDGIAGPVILNNS